MAHRAPTAVAAPWELGREGNVFRAKVTGERKQGQGQQVLER